MWKAWQISHWLLLEMQCAQGAYVSNGGWILVRNLDPINQGSFLADIFLLKSIEPTQSFLKGKGFYHSWCLEMLLLNKLMVKNIYLEEIFIMSFHVSQTVCPVLSTGEV